MPNDDSRTMKAAGESTKPRKLGLCHFRAMDILLSGASVQETADAIGKTRQTVSEWVNHHPGFQARLAEIRAEQDEEQKFAFTSTRGFALTQLRRLMINEKSEIAFRAVTYFLDKYDANDMVGNSAASLRDEDKLLLRVLDSRRVENIRPFNLPAEPRGAR